MRILGISDVHGKIKDIDKLFSQAGDVDLTLISGDLTHFGDANQARTVIEAIRSHGVEVLAVAGNCDNPDVEEYLSEEKINLHQRVLVRAGLVFIGMGKALAGPVATPNETDEEAFRTGLEQTLAAAPPGRPLILLVHQPPYGTLNDRVLFGRHVGSHAIRHFIESHQPLLTFCGHIHEARGIDKIGETYIINPGPLPKGHYGLAELDESGWRVEIRSIQS